MYLDERHPGLRQAAIASTTPEAGQGARAGHSDFPWARRRAQSSTPNVFWMRPMHVAEDCGLSFLKKAAAIAWRLPVGTGQGNHRLFRLRLLTPLWQIGLRAFFFAFQVFTCWGTPPEYGRFPVPFSGFEQPASDAAEPHHPRHKNWDVVN